MALTYAGVALSPPTPDLQDWIDNNISIQDALVWIRPDRVGKNRIPWARDGWTDIPPIQLGTLYWPTGASRFAVGYFVVTDNQLTQIRKKTNVASQSVVQPLVMDTGKGRITTNLWMIHARPLNQLGPSVLGLPVNNLWLMILVDDRYHWWRLDTGFFQINPPTTQWKDLYNHTNLLTKIDAISPNYLVPDSSLQANYEPVGIWLDAIALNVGQRIVRKLDGTVWAQNYATARTELLKNFPLNTNPQAGGFLDVWRLIPTGDINNFLPSQVNVTYPEWYVGNGTNVPANTFLVAQTVLTDLSFPTPFNSVKYVGNGKTKVIHDTAIALFTTTTNTQLQTTSTNLNVLTTNPWKPQKSTFIQQNPVQQQTVMQKLGYQISIDWYSFQTSGLDLKLDYIYPWNLNGLDGAVTWTYTSTEVSTRIQRPPLNNDIEEMNHWTYSDSPFTGTYTYVTSVQCINGVLNVGIGNAVLNNGQVVTLTGGSGGNGGSGMGTTLNTLEAAMWMGY